MKCGFLRVNLLEEANVKYLVCGKSLSETFQFSSIRRKKTHLDLF